MFCPLFSLPNPKEGLTSNRSVAGLGRSRPAPWWEGRPASLHVCVVVSLVSAVGVNPEAKACNQQPHYTKDDCSRDTEYDPDNQKYEHREDQNANADPHSS